MKKALLSIGMAGLMGLAAGAANAGFVADSFQVNESLAAGYGATITADFINGSYTEYFTPTGANTFSTTAVWKGTSMSLNNGTANSLLGGTETILGGEAGYGLYAVFTSSGTFTTSGTVTTLTGTTGTISLYIDKNQDSTYTYGADGTVSYDLSTTDDDILIGGTSTLISAVGIIDTSSAAAGNFDFIFDDLTLTDPYGISYFNGTSIHFTTDIQGNVNDFDPTKPGQFSQSSANVQLGHYVPEPGSLALLGLGLAGLGASQRRKQQTK
jgi:hypothetical protein